MTTGFDVFASLPATSVAGGYSVGSSPRGHHYRIARSSEGRPAVLVEVVLTGESTPRRLKHLHYLPPRELTLISASGATRVEQLAAIECTATERSLFPLFFQLVGALLPSSASAPRLTEARLEVLIDELVELLRALTQPGRTTVQGLWGELAMILWSQDPRAATASWHSSPKARHDFTAGNLGLEVKTTARGLREHHTRMEQVTVPEGGALLLASLVVVEDGDSGASIGDLTAQIGKRVDDDAELVGRITTIVARSLGRGAIEQPPLRFDLVAARRSLLLYDARSVPAIPQPVPAELRGIEYVVDLSSTQPLPLERGRQVAPLFAALLPCEA